jgi:hypothetical protein
MPALHFNRIQSGGIAPIRLSSYPVPAIPCALQGLLAAVLLGVFQWTSAGIITPGLQDSFYCEDRLVHRCVREHKSGR